ncbi:dioxygenase [Pseudomonas sp. RIT-PI-S]|uniref:dioxygenase family protein n=1 Tax=Pseudomonas sp. RIT-PI-S TaxID=3035295 RepID=UPI0021D93DAB|nr:dioxygenase [Pseudomonas sp. RIT-PI-S]
MRNLDETTITQAVLANNRNTADARLCEVMTSLVQHLHGFARDIRLTETEWHRGIEFLSQVGKACSPQRQEFALLSHVLGVSTLVLAQSDDKPSECTEAAAFQPGVTEPAVMHDLGADLSPGQEGSKAYVQGAVRDAQGAPIAYASIEVNVPAEQGQGSRHALLQADDRGQYHFCVAAPRSQCVAENGPVSELLAALNRHAWRPAHLEFTVSAPGYQRVTTQVFREGDPYLDSDAVFGVRSSLVADWVLHPAGTNVAGAPAAAAFYTLAFDFVLASSTAA